MSQDDVTSARDLLLGMTHCPLHSCPNLLPRQKPDKKPCSATLLTNQQLLDLSETLLRVKRASLESTSWENCGKKLVSHRVTSAHSAYMHLHTNTAVEAATSNQRYPHNFPKISPRILKRTVAKPLTQITTPWKPYCHPPTHSRTHTQLGCKKKKKK